MSAFIRILEAAAVLKPVAEGVAVRKALPHIIKLAAIGITTCVIASAVVMFAFYALHVELTLHGFSPETALLLTFCGAVAVLIVFVLWTLQTVHEFKRALLPKPKGVMGIVDSFVDGLKTSAPTEPTVKSYKN